VKREEREDADPESVTGKLGDTETGRIEIIRHFETAPQGKGTIRNPEEHLPMKPGILMKTWKMTRWRAYTTRGDTKGNQIPG